jgi:hypothetical protein
MLMLPFFPGYPGPAMQRRRAAVAPNGLPEHLAQFMDGVRAGRLVPPALPQGGLCLPPDLPGMPKMPPPPPGFMAGAPAGGLFHPLQPVASPFTEGQRQG